MNSNPFVVLFKHSLIYGIGRVLVSLTAFILMPIFTNPKFLSVEAYGIWQILNITLTILVVVLSMGMTTTLFRFYYDTKEANARNSISNTIFWLLLISSALFVILTAFLIQPYILPWLQIDDSIREYLIWIVMIAALQVVSIVPLNILRAEEKPWMYVFFQIAQFVLLLTSLVFFIVYLKWQLEGMIYGYACAFLGNLLLLLFSYRRNITFQIDFSILRKILQFGLPLIVLQLGGWILSVFDRYLVGYQLGYADAAVYGVGYQFGMVVNLAVIMPFSVAWGPFLFKVFRQPDARTVYSKTLNYITFIALYVAFLIATFSKEILFLFTKSPEYLEAQGIIAMVAFAYVFYGMYYVFTTGLNVTNKTFYFPYIILSVSVFNIVANYLLIPFFNITAPAIITIASYAMLAFLTFYYSQKFYRISFEFKRITILLLVFIAFGFIGYYWKYENSYIFFTVKFLTVFLPFVILYLFNFFKAEELHFIKHRVLKLFYG